MNSTRGQPSPEQDFQRRVAMFRTYLSSMHLTGEYIDRLVSCVRKGYGDPLAQLDACSAAPAWRMVRQAWMHWADRWDNDELRLALSKMHGPRLLPPAVRIVPTRDELRLAAEDAAAAPAPWGPLLWILYLSGLRVREVCSIAYDEAVDALRRPEVVVRQKGIGGFARRTWTPGCLVRPALAALLRLPTWRETWVLISTGPVSATAALRKRTKAFRPHDYRHAVARMIRSIGAPADVVSAVLGHDLRGVLGTTAIYAPPSTEEIEEAHARLAAYLWPSGIVPPSGSWLLLEGLPVPSAAGSQAAGSRGRW